MRALRISSISAMLSAVFVACGSSGVDTASSNGVGGATSINATNGSTTTGAASVGAASATGAGGAVASSGAIAVASTTASAGAGGATTVSTAVTATVNATGGMGCAPVCTGKQCGADGCGGVCGTCGATTACTSAGACVSAPPGPASKRFEVATTSCSMADPVCSVGGTQYANCCPTVVPGDPKNKCFCAPEFDHLNFNSQSHFLTVGTDEHKGDIWAAGNFQAGYVDDVNDLYGTMTGGQKADQVIADAMVSFGGASPEYWVVNEISTTSWPTDAAYRAYVVAFAAKMNGTYQKKVIVASPFPAPAANNADWASLAANAFVAVEVQLTGAEVNANGNSVTWCKTQYQNSITAYGNVGVALTRLMLVDNYADSAAGTAFGRQGVSQAGWGNAINARATAAGQLNFAGYISYAWGNNEMSDDNATRAGFEDLYATHALP